MEQNNFKVKYIRLNEPCRMVIQSPNTLYDYKFNIREVYFKEYEDTFDIFFVEDEEKKLYLTAINMQKNIYSDTIRIHINVLKSGHYKIDENSMRRRIDGLVDIKKIEKLEEDIYGTE